MIQSYSTNSGGKSDSSASLVCSSTSAIQTSLGPLSCQRNVIEAWENDLDLEGLASESTRDGIGPSAKKACMLHSTSGSLATSGKTFAEEVEREELRHKKRVQRAIQDLKLGKLNAARIIEKVAHYGPQRGQAEESVTNLMQRDWSSEEMLGLNTNKSKNGPQIRSSEQSSLRLMPQRERVSPFLPQRLLPAARLGRFPGARINIPMSDWNQDTSSIRNPKANRRRGLRIPGYLLTASGTISAKLHIAKLQNEIYAARDRGERHPDDRDASYWSAQALGYENIEDEESDYEEVEQIKFRVPQIIVDDVVNGVSPLSMGSGLKIARPNIEASKLLPKVAKSAKNRAPKTSNTTKVTKAKRDTDATKVVKSEEARAARERKKVMQSAPRYLARQFRQALL